MALVNMRELLQTAQRRGQIIPAFECQDYNMAFSVCETADHLKQPVILMLFPEHCLKYGVCAVDVFAGMIERLARHYATPFALQLDHVADFLYAESAIEAGFNAVMFDCSTLPLHQNMERTRQMTRRAHAMGAAVEGEVGHVGSAEAFDEQNPAYFSCPETVASFCRETAVDAIAISVGNAHGRYRRPPQLDVDRIRTIRALTDTPLVLHGGSGIPDAQLTAARQAGICKINIGTEFFACYYEAISTYVHKKGGQGVSYRWPQFVHGKMQAYLSVKMAAFMR